MAQLLHFAGISLMICKALHLLHGTSAAGTGGSAEGQQLLWMGVKRISARWWAGSREQAPSQSSVAGLYRLTANGRLKQRQSRKTIFSQRRQAAAPLEAQRWLFLSHTAAKASTFLEPRSLGLNSEHSCFYPINIPISGSQARDEGLWPPCSFQIYSFQLPNK